MATNDLESKVEAAAKSVVDALSLTGVTSNTGDDDDTLGLPNVVCSAEQGEEQPLGTGNFLMTLRVTVNSSVYDETLAQHRTRVQTVRDAFMADNIETTLSAASTEFYAFIPWARRIGKEKKEKARCDWIELDFLAASADL